MLDLNQIVSELLETSLELLTLEKGKKITEDYSASIQEISDPVAKKAGEKLLAALQAVPVAMGQLVDAIDILSHQKKILTTPFDQKLLAELRVKFDAERHVAQERLALAKGKTGDELDQLDKKLFEQVGLVIFFEYYVAILITYQKADRQTQDMMFSTKVIRNLGFSAPGIVTGLHNDKGVTTFIYRIQKEQDRRELSALYYKVKHGVVTSDGDPKIVVGAIKSFLDGLLPYFLRYGITDFSELMPKNFNIYTLEQIKSL
ncbi:MAG: hypothetical protein AAB558_02575 [Patescibacteria group bacterium]